MPISFATSTFSAPLVGGFNLYWVDDLALSDLNGDGKADLLVSFHAQQNVGLPLRLLGGDGAGGFSDIASPTFGGPAPSVVMANQFVVADFNGDARPDVFAVDSGHDVNPWPGFHDTLLLSSGASGLRLAPLGELNDMGHAAAAGDIDGDGDLDIYVANIHGQADIGPYFVINNGAGGFAADTGRLPAAVARMQGQVYTTGVLADFNGDGKADLFLGSIGLDAGRPAVFWNDGAGRFSQKTDLPEIATDKVRTYTGAVAADINGDGRLDIVAGLGIDNYNGGALQILVNRGDGTFADETAVRLFSNAPLAPAGVQGFFRPRLFDMNGDGHLDLVLNGYTNTPVLMNDGGGRFVAMPESFVPRPVPAAGIITYYPYPSDAPRPPPAVLVDHFVAGDVDGDGRGDLISARGTDYGASEQYVLFRGLDLGVNVQGDTTSEGFAGDADAETIHAGGGNDVLIGGGGVDYLRGDEGDDYLAGGDGFDDVHGNMGNDTVSGGRGPDWVVGGKDSDLLFGDDGDDVVYGNVGNDTCQGGDGADWVRGGQGDDSLVAGAGADWISGDRGNDTVVGGAGADIFNTFAEAGSDRVLDFNAAEGDRVRVEFGSYTISKVGADTVVDFGAGRQLVLVGVGTFDPGWIVS